VGAPANPRACAGGLALVLLCAARVGTPHGARLWPRVPLRGAAPRAGDQREPPADWGHWGHGRAGTRPGNVEKKCLCLSVCLGAFSSCALSPLKQVNRLHVLWVCIWIVRISQRIREFVEYFQLHRSVGAYAPFCPVNLVFLYYYYYYCSSSPFFCHPPRSSQWPSSSATTWLASGTAS